MMSSPIISDRDLDILRHLEYKGFRTITLPMLFPVGGDGPAVAVHFENVRTGGGAEPAADAGDVDAIFHESFLLS